MKYYHDKYILIADSHIQSGSEKAELFFRMLDHLATLEPAGIIFLGDIFELWIALKGYEMPEHQRFIDWCRFHSAKMEIGFIEGNHEFFVSGTHRDAFSWVTDQKHDLNQTIRLIHGDTVNKKDWRYLLLRGAIRNFFTKFLLKLFAPTIGPRVSDHIRLSLKTSNMAHKKHLPRADLESCALQCSAHGITTVTAGHFHTWEQISSASGTVVNILPAWDIAGEIALMTSDGTLSCLSWEKL